MYPELLEDFLLEINRKKSLDLQIDVLIVHFAHAHFFIFSSNGSLKFCFSALKLNKTSIRYSTSPTLSPPKMALDRLSAPKFALVRLLSVDDQVLYIANTKFKH